MSRKLTKAEIVENAKKTHNDKYDYSLILDDSFKYENAKQKLPIICHEKKERRPHITDDKFISDAKQVHGDTYDYSLVKGCENNHQ